MEGETQLSCGAAVFVFLPTDLRSTRTPIQHAVPVHKMGNQNSHFTELIYSFQPVPRCFST